jgi:hypothetical protein
MWLDWVRVSFKEGEAVWEEWKIDEKKSAKSVKLGKKLEKV